MMFNNPNSYEEVKSLISEDEYKKIYGGSDRLISEKAVLDTIADFIKNNDSVAKLILNINAIPSAEPRYCDRNICLRNEYNGISCDECEVGNPCLYCKHEFEPQESEG